MPILFRHSLWSLMAVALLAACAAPTATPVPSQAIVTATAGPAAEPQRTSTPQGEETTLRPSAPEAAALVVSPREFGGIPDDDEDDGQALRVALARAAAEPNSVVELEPGTYLVDGPDSGFHLMVSGARGLRIIGNGARLVMRNPSSAGFRFDNCHDVHISDLTIDYDPVPFSQGTITAVDHVRGTFDMAVDEGYPHPRSWFFLRSPLNFGMVRLRETAMLREDVADHFMVTRWEEIEPDVYRAHLDATFYRQHLARVQPGDAFVYVARAGSAAVDIYASSDVTIENVTVHASITCAVTLVHADAVVVRGLTVEIPPGSDRLNSVNADGVHAQQSRIGPRIEDSHFEGMSDDGINIYTVPNLVRGVHPDTRISVTGSGQMQVGDELEIWDPITGALRGHATIAALDSEGGLTNVTLDSAVSGLRAGDDYRNADHVYNRDASGEGFAVVRNVFQNHRRYAIFIKSGHGLIEGNTIRNLSGNGIVIANEPDWPEGPMSRDITVRNNEIDYVGYSGSYGLQPDGAAIHIKGNKLGFGLAEWRGQRGIVIEGNTIRNWPRNAIYLGSAEGVMLRDNQLQSVITRADIPADQSVGVLIENCARVTIRGLEVSEPRSIRAVVEIDGRSDMDTIAVEGLTGLVAHGVPHVLSAR